MVQSRQRLSRPAIRQAKAARSAGRASQPQSSSQGAEPPIAAAGLEGLGHRLKVNKRPGWIQRFDDPALVGRPLAACGAQRFKAYQITAGARLPRKACPRFTTPSPMRRAGRLSVTERRLWTGAGQGLCGQGLRAGPPLRLDRVGASQALVSLGQRDRARGDAHRLAV